MSTDLKRRVAVSVAWSTSARVAIRMIGLVSTMVLARLLTPADFGLVAMAMAVAAGLELLTLFSFESALIQQKQITRAHYDSAWTLNLLLGLALALALVLIAAPAAAFYREPRLEGVMFLIACKYALDSAGNPGTVDFRRELTLGREFALQVAPKLVSLLITIPLAIVLRDYRALLAGMVLGSAVNLSLSYLLHGHRPRWCLTEARPLFQFSRWLLLNNLVGFARTRSADFIIGRISGPSALGAFSVASEVASLPSSEMVAPINRVMFPAYVKLADDLDGLREGFRSTLAFIALVILPASVGLAATAEPLVRVALGEKWVESAPLISLLALAGTAEVLTANTGSLYNAIGKPRMIALTGGLLAILLIPLLLFAALHFGPVGAAWAMLIHSFAFGMPITYALLFRYTPIHVSDVVGVCWRPVVACGAMYCGVHYFAATFAAQTTFTDSLVELLLCVLLGVLIYVGAVFVLWHAAGRPQGAESFLLAKCAATLQGFRRGLRNSDS